MNKKVSFENLDGLQKRGDGLSETDSVRQRSRFGANEIVERVGNPWFELAQETIKDPMIWFLLGIGTVFVWVGEIQEAVILFLAILPLVFMDAILHWRTQASTAALKGQLATEAKVIRGGREVILPSREIVPGDLVVLSLREQFLPADGIFESTEDLQVDESALTGEAFPIQKYASTFDPFPLAKRGEVMVDASHLGYAGTRVLTGHALLRVLFTGRATAYGEVVQSVASVPHERTGLQLAISKLVRSLILIAGAFCVILAGVRFYQGHGWLDALLSAATLAVAAIPEEFPVVFTFFLGVGVYRLAKRHALVRRAVSVENIGRVTRICSDKTGTITIGQLKLTHIDASTGPSEVEVLKVALAASDPTGADPVDQAIVDLAQQKDLGSPPRERVFPFTEDRKRESAFIVSQSGDPICCMKGSPETILSRSNLTLEERQEWISKTSKWARGGHKVLACAWRPISPREFSQEIEPEDGFHFAGLLAFEDPPRPEVIGAVDECRKNGIRVMMITGDHPQTAAAIARDVRLGGEDPKVASAEDNPERFEETWLFDNPEFIRGLDVVARCSPLQKFRIVNALKRSGDLVAVTGDGVNDVPALKAADIGIAMGLRGTRSAKEVSSIILADDNFSSIVNAIMEGRQLFSNLKSSFEYLLLFHIPFVLTAALIPFMGHPLLYLPVHIVWLELIIHPTALFAFQENASARNVGAPSRGDSFFSNADATRVALLGLGLTGAVVLTYLSGLTEGADIRHARAKVLALLLLWSAGLVLVLTRARNKAAWTVIIVTVISGAVLIQVPALSEKLHLSPLHFRDWSVAAGVVMVFLLFQIIAPWLLRPMRTEFTH